jgi:sulfite exporter TauE/SafE
MMGLISSMHCLGMCGPLIIAMPLQDHTFFARTKNGLLYHAGRISTYVLFGAVAGLLGYTFFAGMAQQNLSVLMGGLMLIYVIFSWLGKRWGYRWSASVSGFFWSLRQRLAGWSPFKNNKSVFVLGLLNGLLPCGVVYLALSSAIAAGSTVGGILYMFFFGLGTTPALFSLGLVGGAFKIQWRNKIQKAVPAMLTILALLLVLRGLNLGIPFVSPEMTETHRGCCTKP